MRKLVLILFAVVASLAAMPAASAGAETPSSSSIDVPVTSIVRGDAGSTHQLADVAVDPAMQGLTCAVVADAENNESVHPDTNLIVSSGGNSVQILDVEAVPNATTPADGTLVLGPELVVSVTLGGDGVFSGGITVSLSCEPTPPPTVPPTSPPTTTAPPSASSTTVVRTEVAPAAVSTQAQAVAVVAQPRTTG
jgi:hypothetical protein